MKIKKLFDEKTVLSVEVFPPKLNGDLKKIYSMIDKISVVNPDYISVTYGAGGTSKDNTIDIASNIKRKYNIEALAHLTCIGSSKDEVDMTLKKLKDNKIENILALRGDYPKETNNIRFNDFNYASQLIEYIKKDFDGFSIGAAAYPEGHVEIDDKILDLKNLKKKCDIGSDFLVSQLFFDNDIFYSFIEKLKLLDVDIPISAGIIPVIKKEQIEKICKLSGATLPRKFLKIINKYEHNPNALKAAGIAYATEQIIDLISEGVDGVHLYGMNRDDVVIKIFDNIANLRDVESKKTI